MDSVRERTFGPFYESPPKNRGVLLWVSLQDDGDGLIERVSGRRAQLVGADVKYAQDFDFMPQRACGEGSSWDGVACSGQQQHLYFGARSAYTSSKLDLAVGEQISDFSVEFWILPG